MAKTAAERRAARKRKDERRSQRPAEPREAPPQEQLLRQLVHAGARAMAGFGAGDAAVMAERLAVLDPVVDADGVVERIGIDLLANLWEHGWQPADAVHAVRRQGSARATRLAVAFVLRQAGGTEPHASAPDEWRDQLTALAEEGVLQVGPGSLVTHWARREGIGGSAAWRDVLSIVAQWGHVIPLAELCPPPSRWGRAVTRDRSTRHVDPRMLGKIRGLLAKAESTEFPDEAEALSAKAQQLMTRYAVDSAVLDAGGGRPLADEVRTRRVHLLQPYAEAKVQLLASVAAANGVRSVWHDDLGMATVVGLPIDLELTELLFTSLLVQATRAMTETGRAGSSRTRSASFRRSFLLSYALRIGERLEEARESGTAEAEAASGTALVPVLAARDDAVDEAVAGLFPNLRSMKSRISDAQGWHAGRLAAEHADLRASRTEKTG
jgi:hypothetical protein